tara:strand:- start:1876 stop:2934 length:1059 start_codon:yes stop_codon:yes gene_type:complete
MTGTSMDGIDISMVKTNGLDLKRLNQNYYYEYSTETKTKLINILKNNLIFNLENKEYLDDFITFEHYQALKDLEIVKSCDLIGFHGQTIFHDPINKTSIQLGDPKKLSRMLNKNVVFDFRSNDLRLGGQGAPIAPIYHKFIIEKINLKLPACIINIGGIANLTYWDGKELIGFDTGPGNVLMDNYSMTMFNQNFDKNGDFASKGTPIKEEVTNFLQQVYFEKPPPKSLDKLSFMKTYKTLILKKYSNYDIMATLLEYTTESIATSLNLLPKKISNLIITGGGYRNHYLMKKLRERLDINVIDEKKSKLNFDYIEAELIGYLSARSIYKLPFTFPSTTGVSKPSSGGGLYSCL